MLCASSSNSWRCACRSSWCERSSQKNSNMSTDVSSYLITISTWFQSLTSHQDTLDLKFTHSVKLVSFKTTMSSRVLSQRVESLREDLWGSLSQICSKVQAIWIDSQVSSQAFQTRKTTQTKIESESRRNFLRHHLPVVSTVALPAPEIKPLN